MRRLAPLVLLIGVASGVGAIALGARAQAPRWRAPPTECWESPGAPCPPVGSFRLEVDARPRPVHVRVLRVEARAPGARRWHVSEGPFLLLSGARRHRSPWLLAAGGPIRSHVFFDALPVGGEAVIRITVAIDGRRDTITTRRTIVSIEDDPMDGP